MNKKARNKGVFSVVVMFCLLFTLLFIRETGQNEEEMSENQKEKTEVAFLQVTPKMEVSNLGFQNTKIKQTEPDKEKEETFVSGKKSYQTYIGSGSISNISSKDPDFNVSKLYADEDQIASEEMKCQLHVQNFSKSEEQLRSNEMKIKGIYTVVIVTVKENTTMNVEYSAKNVTGKFKLCLVDSDGKVMTISEGQGSSKQNIALKKGRNILKMVGENASVNKLNILYEKPNKEVLDGWYFSEKEEKAQQAYKEFHETGVLDITAIVKGGPFLEEEKINEVIAAILQKKQTISKADLTALLPFANERILSKYILQLVQENKVGSLGTLNASLPDMAPFLTEECVTELFYYAVNNKTEFTKNQLTALLPFVEEEILSKYILQMIQKDKVESLGRLNSVLPDMAPFLTEECVTELFYYAVNNKTEFTKNQLTALLPFVEEEILSKYILQMIQKDKVESLGRLNSVLPDMAPFLTEECVTELFYYAINNKTEFTKNQITALIPFIEEEALSKCIEEMLQKNKAIDSDLIQTILPFLNEEAIEEYLKSLFH